MVEASPALPGTGVVTLALLWPWASWRTWSLSETGASVTGELVVAWFGTPRVFVALLSHVVPESRLIGALLGYRAIYYIGPLAVAALLYLAMELRGRREAHHPRAAQPPGSGAA